MRRHGYPRHLLAGLCMGAADVVPGISGANVAWLFGIYPRLITALGGLTRLHRGGLRQADFRLLLPLGIGILLAIGFFTRVVPLQQWVVDAPRPVFSLFCGLILSSLGLLLLTVRARAADVLLLGGAGAVCGLLLLEVIPPALPNTAPWLLLCGVVCVCAMLLPGLSGSYVLLLFGKYVVVLDAVASLDWDVLLPFALGVAGGAVAFARLLTRLLYWRYQLTLLFLAGLLLSSLVRIWMKYAMSRRPDRHRK